MRIEHIPEVELAAAVIRGAVLDLKSGSVGRREKASADIRAGGLDYWIEMVDDWFDVGVEIEKGLGRLSATANVA